CHVVALTPRSVEKGHTPPSPNTEQPRNPAFQTLEDQTELVDPRDTQKVWRRGIASREARRAQPTTGFVPPGSRGFPTLPGESRSGREVAQVASELLSLPLIGSPNMY